LDNKDLISIFESGGFSRVSKLIGVLLTAISEEVEVLI
jgi:hypothetical protein